MILNLSRISSLHNEKIKHIDKLTNHLKYRKKCNQFVSEGIKIIKEAVKAKIKIESLFVTKKSYKKYIKDLEELANFDSFPLYEVSEEIMYKISDMMSPPGIICICKVDKKDISYSEMLKSDKILILENIQDPHNLGTVFRICDAMKIEFVVLTKGSCDIYNPKVLRGSMGSIFRLNVLECCDIAPLILDLKNSGFKTYASVVDKKGTSISEVAFGEKAAVIVGNEGRGICPETIKLCDEKITIPTNEEIDSLNAAVAAGIIIWEMTGRGRNILDK